MIYESLISNDDDNDKMVILYDDEKDLSLLLHLWFCETKQL